MVFDKGKLQEIQKKEKIEKKHTIMIVDDEKNHLESMENLLSTEYHIITAPDGQEALGIINNIEHPEEISLVISDQRMPGLTGIQLFEKLKDIIPDTLRIILTGYDDKDVMMTAINKINIYQFILKPFDPDELKLRLIRAVEAFESQQELDRHRENLEHMVEERTNELINTREQLTQKEKLASLLEKSLFSEGPNHPEYFKHIITVNKKMLDIFKLVEAIAITDEPVLITGETGTGKDLIAQAIHNVSRRKGNFIIANIAGFDDSLFSDTLFGHEKGSFTDAKSKRQGLVEKARDGTFFLDEIGDLQVLSQIKLLRLIEKKEYYRIGLDETIKSNARFILATNRDLNAMIDTNEFRKDLYFRLITHHIQLPPLRERKEDILPLFEYFIQEASKTYGKKINPVSERLIFQLSRYQFPGNIRELRSMIFEAVCLHQSEEPELSLNVFIKKIREQNGKISFSHAGVSPGYTDEEKNGIVFVDSFPTFENMKKIYADEALRLAGTQQGAAELSGIDIKTLRKYLKGE
jgi:DNA-binding NtrC family response regulator